MVGNQKVVTFGVLPSSPEILEEQVADPFTRVRRSLFKVDITDKQESSCHHDDECRCPEFGFHRKDQKQFQILKEGWVNETVQSMNTPLNDIVESEICNIKSAMENIDALIRDEDLSFC